MIILGRRRAAKNLADVINDGVASGPQFTNNFEFRPLLLMVCGRSVLGGAVIDKTKRFTKEGNSLANDVAVGKDILDVRGNGRVVLGRGRRLGKVVRVRRRIGWTRESRKGRERK